MTTAMGEGPNAGTPGPLGVHWPQRTPPILPCHTCRTPLADCQDSHAMGTDACCMACDATGQGVAHG